MTSSFVALGSNLADPPRQIEAALQALGGLPSVRIEAVSRLYRSAPVGPQDQPDFCNAVAALCWPQPPAEQLAALQRIERDQGRERTRRWGPRTLDLDLLAVDDTVLDSAALTLPHPRAHLRAFVIVPWAEIAPAFVLPGHGPVGELLRPGMRDALTPWATDGAAPAAAEPASGPAQRRPA